MSKFKWVNIFVRDILLSIVIVVVNWYANFNSWWAAFTMGAMVVLVTWHLQDLIKYKRRINSGIYRPNGDSGSSSGIVSDNIQQNQKPGFEGLFGRN